VQVQVSPSSLSIPAGGGGFVTVTATRTPGAQGPLTLSLDQPPPGLVGSGTIAGNDSTGTLALWVDPSVAPQAIPNLRVKASEGTAEAETVFALTVAPPLPLGLVRPDLVQAGGGTQQGGSLVNTPVAQEPVATTTASDPAKVVVVRHGFHPSVPYN
jgi:hypothetical protein